VEDYRFYSSLLFSSSPPPSLSSLQSVTISKAGQERFYGAEVWARVGGYRNPSAAGRLLQYGMGWLPDKSVNPTLIYDNFLSDGAVCPPLLFFPPLLPFTLHSPLPHPLRSFDTLPKAE
jgi:hypothetical protein